MVFRPGQKIRRPKNMHQVRCHEKDLSGRTGLSHRLEDTPGAEQPRGVLHAYLFESQLAHNIDNCRDGGEALKESDPQPGSKHGF